MTGAKSAAWLGLTAMVEGSNPPQARTFFVRAADVHIEHTWEGMLGMASSGSHAVRADGAFCPAGLSYSFVDPQPLITRPTYQIRPYQMFSATGVGVVLGVWRSAIDATTATVGGKRSSFDGSLQAELVSVQIALAEADSAYRAVRAGVQAEAEELWRVLSRAGATTPAERAPLWGLLLTAPTAARESVSRLYAASSTVAWHGDHAASRAVQDIHAISVAFERFSKLLADVGRVHTGLDPLMPVF